MSAFDAMIDSLFGDPNLGVAAEYFSVDAPSTPVPVTVIKRLPPVEGQLLRPGFVLSPERQAVALTADVRRSEVANAKPGDALVIPAGGQLYRVPAKVQPTLDSEKLVWTLPLIEAVA